MDYIFYVVILFAVLALVSDKLVLFAIMIAVGLLGPVASHYWLTGDKSLAWEAAFRGVLLLICIGGVKLATGLVDGHTRLTKPVSDPDQTA